MRLARFVAVFAALLCISSPAYSHAILLSAAPARGASVQGNDVQINLRFNSRVDAKRSRMTLVVTGDGTARALTIDDQSPPDSLKAQIRGLKTGSYTIQWQVLAVDGHISRGTIPFNVQ